MMIRITPFYIFILVLFSILIGTYVAQEPETVVLPSNTDFILSPLAEPKPIINFQPGDFTFTPYPISQEVDNFPERITASDFFIVFNELEFPSSSINILLVLEANGEQEELKFLFWNSCFSEAATGSNCSMEGPYIISLFCIDAEKVKAFPSPIEPVLVDHREPVIADDSSTDLFDSCLAPPPQGPPPMGGLNIPPAQFCSTNCDTDTPSFPAPAPAGPYISPNDNNLNEIEFNPNGIWSTYIAQNPLRPLSPEEAMQELEVLMQIVVITESEDNSLTESEILGIALGSAVGGLTLLCLLCCLCCIVMIIAVILATLISVGGTMIFVRPDPKQQFSVHDYIAPSSGEELTDIPPPQEPADVGDIVWDEVELLERLGSGAFGVVYRGQWHGADVAVKRLHATSLNLGECPEEMLAEIREEARLMRKVGNHPNVVKFVGTSVIESEGLALITEFCPMGSLEDIITQNRRWRRLQRKGIEEKEAQPEVLLDEPTIVKFSRDAAAGLLHLHKCGIVHRDIAARNMLIGKDGTLQISDFGLARIQMQDTYGKTDSNVGPIRWMAPESLKEQKYSEKSDAFSFGVAIWEMVVQKDPWGETLPIEIAVCVAKGKRLHIPESTDPVLRKLMKKCWKQRAEERPKFDDIYSTLKLHYKELMPEEERVRRLSSTHSIFGESSTTSEDQSTGSSIIVEKHSHIKGGDGFAYRFQESGGSENYNLFSSKTNVPPDSKGKIPGSAEVRQSKIRSAKGKSNAPAEYSWGAEGRGLSLGSTEYSWGGGNLGGDPEEIEHKEKKEGRKKKRTKHPGSKENRAPSKESNVHTTKKKKQKKHKEGEKEKDRGHDRISKSERDHKNGKDKSKKERKNHSTRHNDDSKKEKKEKRHKKKKTRNENNKSVNGTNNNGVGGYTDFTPGAKHAH